QDGLPGLKSTRFARSLNFSAGQGNSTAGTELGLYPIRVETAKRSLDPAALREQVEVPFRIGEANFVLAGFWRGEVDAHVLEAGFGLGPVRDLDADVLDAGAADRALGRDGQRDVAVAQDDRAVVLLADAAEVQLLLIEASHLLGIARVDGDVADTGQGALV